MTDRRLRRSGENRVCRDPVDVVIVKRWQTGKDGAGIRGDGVSRGIEACKRRHVLDAGCRQNDIDCAFNYGLRPIEGSLPAVS